MIIAVKTVINQTEHTVKTMMVMTEKAKVTSPDMMVITLDIQITSSDVRVVTFVDRCDACRLRTGRGDSILAHHWGCR